MADNDGVSLGLVINPVDIEKVKQQLDNLIKEYSSKKIDLKIDTSSLNAISTQITNLSNSINSINIAGLNNGLAKTSQTFDSSGKLVKSVEQIKSGIGEATTYTQVLNKETQKLSNPIKTVTVNYEAQQKAIEKTITEQQKLADLMANGREKSEAKRSNNDRTLELKQSQAINKALDDQYKLQSKNQNGVDYLIQKREQEAAQFSKLLQSQMQQEVNIGKTSDQADKLVNKMREMNSLSLLKTEFESLNNELINYTARLKAGEITQEEFTSQNFDKRISDISSQIQVAKNGMGDFTTKVLENVKAFASWYIIGGLVSGVVRSLKDGISTITELDKRMVELRKVTDETDSVYKKFYYSANQTAKALGQSTQAVIEATASWSQMGFAIEDATKLAEGSAIFANISESMDIGAATDTMISAIKAYGIQAEDAVTGVVDKVNSLGNAFAVTSKDLVCWHSPKNNFFTPYAIG